MKEFLESIQYSEFGLWVAGGDCICAYPLILALHTVGLGVVVGLSAILACRVLGMGSSIPFANLRPLFRIIWCGFALNAVTGVMLFIAAASDKFYQEIFYVKLGFIFLALMAVSRIRRTVYSPATNPDGPLPQNAKLLAAGSLVCWVGAIITGRLMAYVTTF